MSTKLLLKKFLQASEILKTCQKEVIQDFKNYDFFEEITLNYSDSNFIKKKFFYYSYAKPYK